MSGDDEPCAPEPERKPKANPEPRFVDPIAHLSPSERRKLPVNVVGGLRAMVPAPTQPEPAQKKAKPARKNNPRLISAARELRDRWLEAIARDPSAVLPSGKYDVARAVGEEGSDRSLTVAARPGDGRASLPEIIEPRLLPQAA